VGAAAPDPLPPAPPTETVAPVSNEPGPEPTNAVPTATETGEIPDDQMQITIGSCLEVYSNTYKDWCPGVVTGIEPDGSAILMAYQVPGEPVDANISTKHLPVDSPELALPKDTGAWLTASVEVYSHSNKAWCMGKVTEINNGIMSVVFFYPGEPEDAVPVMKQLVLGDKDVRLRGIDAAFLQFPGGAAAGLGHDSLKAGDPVEVYSNSLGVWCAGSVQEIGDGVATIAFFYPDMDQSTEAPAVKELPLGHQDLRIPGVSGAAYNTGPPVTEADIAVGGQLEVFSQSRQVWILSEITEIKDGQAVVQLRYPDVPNEVFEKVLPIGHTDMRLPTGA